MLAISETPGREPAPAALVPGRAVAVVLELGVELVVALGMEMGVEMSMGMGK